MSVNHQNHCPVEDELLEFLEQPSSLQDQAIARHVLACPNCAALMAEHHRLQERLDRAYAVNDTQLEPPQFSKVEEILDKWLRAESAPAKVTWFEILAGLRFQTVGMAICLALATCGWWLFLEYQASSPRMPSPGSVRHSSGFRILSGTALKSCSASGISRSEIGAGVIEPSMTYEVATSALVEITAENGPRMKLSSSSRFSLTETRCHLLVGSLEYRSGLSSGRIEIQTPHCRIRPIGTEFSVQVGVDWTHVKVRSGRVELFALAGARIVEAGDAVRVGRLGFERGGNRSEAPSTATTTSPPVKPETLHSTPTGDCDPIRGGSESDLMKGDPDYER